RVGGDVARSRDHRAQPFEAAPFVLEHVLEEVDGAVSSRLGPDQRAAVFEALAGQYPVPVVGDPLVLAEHVADLARTDPDVAGRHVDVGPDVAVELGHEGLAEAHDLALALALRIEVRPALAAAHRQPGQRVLEGLLESKELEHALVDAWVEADAALVGADRVVVLHAAAALDADPAVIVLPADTEADHPVGLGYPAQDLLGVVGLLVLDEIEDVLGHLLHRLDELGLVRVAALHALHEGRKVNVIGNGHGPPLSLRATPRGVMNRECAVAQWDACHAAAHGADSRRGGGVLWRAGMAGFPTDRRT